ncbi:MAG: hypothetical protein BWY79_01974 [Actinobacteria bacterium ADurb.Bin444]|nr:MAG: hypothetical protein BWY79_01974 [Actinobacteria bacterium ADurb.Bin444]
MGVAGEGGGDGGLDALGEAVEGVLACAGGGVACGALRGGDVRAVQLLAGYNIVDGADDGDTGDAEGDVALHDGAAVELDSVPGGGEVAGLLALDGVDAGAEAGELIEAACVGGVCGAVGLVFDRDRHAVKKDVVGVVVGVAVQDSVGGLRGISDGDVCGFGLDVAADTVVSSEGDGVGAGRYVGVCGVPGAGPPAVPELPGP